MTPYDGPLSRLTGGLTTGFMFHEFGSAGDSDLNKLEATQFHQRNVTTCFLISTGTITISIFRPWTNFRFDPVRFMLLLSRVLGSNVSTHRSYIRPASSVAQFSKFDTTVARAESLGRVFDYY